MIAGPPWQYGQRAGAYLLREMKKHRPSWEWVSIPMLMVLAASLGHAGSKGDQVRGRMMEILNQVADLVRQNYYDPALKNLDWKAATELARQRIRRADNEGDMAAAISGLLVRLDDSHTFFLRPQRLQPVVFGFRAKAFGDDVRIYEIMDGGPAQKAGLQRGDQIIGIQGFIANRKLVDSELRYFQYLDPRLTMDLKIVRGSGTPRDYVIKGKQPATSSKQFAKLIEEYREESIKAEENASVRQESGGVAYLRFPSFMVPTREPDSLLKEARSARALVLDLRDDPGGREETLKEMAGHFFNQPVELMLAISRDRKDKITVKPRNPNLTIPLFVLVDSHSASAAEILARILQLHKRAAIIGDRTAGRVNIAEWFGGTGGAVYQIPFGVSITIAQVLMPDGLELENRGVVPDIRCLPTVEDLQRGRDPCLEKALALARQAESPANAGAKSSP